LPVVENDVPDLLVPDQAVIRCADAVEAATARARTVVIVICMLSGLLQAEASVCGTKGRAMVEGLTLVG
jgi:hypothetical protein